MARSLQRGTEHLPHCAEGVPTKGDQDVGADNALSGKIQASWPAFRPFRRDRATPTPCDPDKVRGLKASGMRVADFRRELRA